MSTFVDSSVWFASVVARDRNNARARSILVAAGACVTSDHVLVDTWLLLNSRYHRRGAEQFWDGIRRGAATVEVVTGADIEAAWAIGQIFTDQAFSIVDRTSFAVMERLGLTASQASTMTSQFTGMVARAREPSTFFGKALRARQPGGRHGFALVA